MSARAYLREQLELEYRTYFGLPSREFLDGVVDAWMSDDRNSKHRFDAIERELPGKKRVLDLASGCGSAVFYGLLNGYDMAGIDPETWKHTFNAMKANELGYPPKWLDRFQIGVGERLPYDDDAFDCVTSYQTLEHVQDLDRVVGEMLRVTRAGGGLHIQCPDYRGSFEGHYRLPWLPLMPRVLAKAYLGALGRPLAGLDTLNYVTPRRLAASFAAQEQRRPGLRLRFVHRGGRPLRTRVRSVFREEWNIDTFVHVLAK
jgi:SAM-dependent methyltransferase